MWNFVSMLLAEPKYRKIGAVIGLVLLGIFAGPRLVALVDLPTNLEAHQKAMQSHDSVMRGMAIVASTKFDSLLEESRESNRLAKCNLSYTTSTARLRCANGVPVADP
jgi:hypothetical protein